MKRYTFIFICAFSLSCAFSQSIYHKDDITILADSLTEVGSYKQAIIVRQQAIKSQKKASKDYQAYMKAKYYHTKSCDYEFDSYSYYKPDKIITHKVREKYLDSALQAAVIARDLYLKVEQPDRMFQYKIQSRIYHQTAYLGDWKHALEQAQLAYHFLIDTLETNNKTFVNLIYDIGYIYDKLGDHSNAVVNYQASLDIYNSIVVDNATDIAQAYNNIAGVYKNLGLRKKELESLLKAKTIWEQLNQDEDQRFLFNCYGNLSYWYSYYGDFDKAEEYILKRNKLRKVARTTKNNEFLRNKEEIYNDKLSEWYDLMLHYSRKKDTLKTVFYAENIFKTIDPNKKLFDFEAKILSATLKFYATFIEKSNPEEALLMLDKAIDNQENHKEVFYTKPFDFKLYKAELLLESKKYSEATILLDNLNNLNETEEISNRFILAILNAKTAQALNKKKKAKSYFDSAFSLLKESDNDIECLAIEDLKPFISFETIDGFLAMGDFYMQIYKEKNSKEQLKKATHRYLLASQIYNQLYLGLRYNESLFARYNAINERLLKVALEQPDNINLLSEVLNIIENNGSKLTWSKFVFNNQRQQLNIPESFINQEENIKAQLNFYQDVLINPKGNPEEKIVLWKDKIYELKNDLSKIQDSIKERNQTYYQLNVKNFEIGSLQKKIRRDELLLKYIMTDSFLYAFLISKETIKLVPISEKTKVLNSLKACLKALKQREANYQDLFKDMSNLLFHQIAYRDYRKLIIVPDGPLHYFPFEALILDTKMPDISYASSLLLYHEQRKMPLVFENIRIGAFSASDSNSKLPKVSDEIQAILHVFDGQGFINASEAEFMENANSFNVLHLAMHSNINELHPEFSSLNFYGENDNKLFISELYNEILNAKMVVLSACDTGNGFYENGEGVISLSRAFNYAGIPSTVMSLWKVDDEATAKIMSYFYEHLKQGEAKDEALKNAKLDYLKYTDDDLLKHPYYWSGFVVSGNTDALVETDNNWIYLFILPLIVVGFYRKKLVQFFKK